MEEKKHHRKKRILPLFLVMLLLIILAGAAAVTVKNVSSTRREADTDAYYKLTADAASGREAALEDELAIVMEGSVLSERAVCIDGYYYISRGAAETYIEERLYYGEEDGILLLTNAVSTYKTYCDSTSYSLDGTTEDLGYVLVTAYNDTIYISLEYLKLFSNMEYTVYSDPARVVITYETGDIVCCDCTRDTRVRTGAYKTAEFIAKLEEGTVLKVLSYTESGAWVWVVSEEGWVGYVSVGDITEEYTQTVTGDYTDPEYTSLSLGEPVVIGFAALYNSSANSYYSEITENAGDAMNVYCPTWYSLSDEGDYLESISSAEYVEKAHADGYLVWAVFSDSNISTGEVYGDDVLSSYEKRMAVIDAVMADMEAKGIDGLNMDFESVETSYSEDYLQFLRELSQRCRAEGKYFTADNYAPYEFNDAIFSISEQNDLCDYVIIMTYDDYLGTDEAGPNSSTPFLEEVLELSLSKLDSEKLIIALPFYTRFWYETDESLSNKAFSVESSWSLVELAGAEAVWDEELGLYYAEYEEDGSTVYAWLENEDSYADKLAALSEYDTGGIGFWRLGWGTAEIWQQIEEYY